jgi:hypothetical protein
VFCEEVAGAASVSYDGRVCMLGGEEPVATTFTKDS